RQTRPALMPVRRLGLPSPSVTPDRTQRLRSMLPTHFLPVPGLTGRLMRATPARVGRSAVRRPTRIWSIVQPALQLVQILRLTWLVTLPPAAAAALTRTQLALPPATMVQGELPLRRPSIVTRRWALPRRLMRP